MNCMKSSLLELGAVFLVTAQAGEEPSNFEIATLSNRADLISGGDALVEVRVPKNVPPNGVRLSLPSRVIRVGYRRWPSAPTARRPSAAGTTRFAYGTSRAGNPSRPWKVPRTG